MRKLISVAVAVAFALTLATMAMAAPKKAAKKAEPKTVKAEVVKVEKMKKATILVVKINGKVKKLHVAKVALKEAEALKAGEKVELTVHGMWVKGIKAEAAEAAPAAVPAPAAAPAPAPAAK